ncbi:MAG: hypothetical protein GX206_06490 [Clostridiales bacterium]|nr:hypothetical protein [Clostridiales bacterium]
MIDQFMNTYIINTILSILLIVNSIVFQNKYPEMFSDLGEEEDKAGKANIGISDGKQKNGLLLILAFILFTPYINMIVAVIMAVSTFLNVYKYKKNRER